MFFLAATLALVAQTQEGAVRTGLGCTSVINGATTEIVAADVGVFVDAVQKTPKQGDVFYVFINVASFSQPCAANLMARPAFRLPPGIAQARSVLNPLHCFLGTVGHMTSTTCPLGP